MIHRPASQTPRLAKADLSAMLENKDYRKALKDLERSLTAVQQTYLWPAAGFEDTKKRS